MKVKEMDTFDQIKTIKIIYPVKDSAFFFKGAGFPKKIKNAEIINKNDINYIKLDDEFIRFDIWDNEFMIIDYFDKLRYH
jgi:hypothetical protein